MIAPVVADGVLCQPRVSSSGSARSTNGAAEETGDGLKRFGNASADVFRAVVESDLAWRGGTASEQSSSIKSSS